MTMNAGRAITGILTDSNGGMRFPLLKRWWLISCLMYGMREGYYERESQSPRRLH